MLSGSPIFASSLALFYRIYLLQITYVVNEQLDKLFPASDFPGLRVIAEPGRYYAASAFTLVTNVIAKKKVNKEIEDAKQNGRWCFSRHNIHIREVNSDLT